METRKIRLPRAHVHPINDVDEMRSRYPEYRLPDLPDIRVCPRIPGAEASVWRLVYILAGEMMLGRMPPEPETEWIDFEIGEEVPLAGLVPYLEKMGIPASACATAVRRLKERGVPIFEVEPVALRSVDGMWVRAHLDSGGTCKANAENRADWETFGLVRLDDTRIGLLALNGKWVGAHLETDGTLKADIDFRHDWEEFNLHVQEDGKIALQAFNSTWVGCYGDGVLKADRSSISSRETFALIRIR